MMEYHYVWLIWSVGFLCPWAILYVTVPEHRMVMWKTSLFMAPFGLTEPLFVPEYWNPPSLFDLAQRTGFDIESIIFSFAIGGIGAVLYGGNFAVTRDALDAIGGGSGFMVSVGELDDGRGERGHGQQAHVPPGLRGPFEQGAPRGARAKIRRPDASRQGLEGTKIRSMAALGDTEPRVDDPRRGDMMSPDAPGMTDARRRLRVKLLRDLVANGLYTVEVEALLVSGDTAARPVAAQPVASVALADEGRARPIEESTPVAAGAAGHYVQLGAFGVKENADRFLERVRALLDVEQAPVGIVFAGTLYRVRSGPYAERSAAEASGGRLDVRYGTGPSYPANLLVWDYPELGMTVQLQDRSLTENYMLPITRSYDPDPTPNADSLARREEALAGPGGGDVGDGGGGPHEEEGRAGPGEEAADGDVRDVGHGCQGGGLGGVVGRGYRPGSPVRLADDELAARRELDDDPCQGT